MTRPKILIAGVDPDIAGLEDCLPGLGYTVCAAVRCGRQAVALAAEARPDLALIDLGLEGEISGIDAAGQLRSQFNVPVIYLTDDGSASLWRRARMNDPFGCLLKPFAEGQLRWTIDAALSLHGRETKLKERERRLEREAAELRQRNEELQDEAQLLKIVFHSVSDGVVVTGSDGQFLLVNPVAEQIAGMGATEKDPDQWAETYGTFYPDGETPFPSEDLPLVRAMRGEPVDDVELTIRNRQRPQGIVISVNARPLQDDSGKMKGGVIVIRNITALKNTEKDLLQKMAELRSQSILMETVINSISDGLIVTDKNGKYLIFNEVMERLVGKPEPDVARRVEKYGLYYPDKETLFSREDLQTERAIRGEATDHIEMFVRNQHQPEGVFVNISGRPLRDESGAAAGSVVVVHDVDQIKKAEIKLQETATRLQSQNNTMESIFHSISDGVIVAGEDGKRIMFNASAERIVGVGISDSSPAQWAAQYGIFFPDKVTMVPTEELPLVRALRGEDSDDVELFIRNPNVPAGVFISVSGRPIRTAAGVPQGGVVAFRDVSERVQAEQALLQAFAQGRLEVVDTILHNIGNAISSVSIGVGTLAEELHKNETLRRFSALAQAVEAHRSDWITYLDTDPQGRKIMPFILALAADFTVQNERLTGIAERVESRVAHIVDIIRTQKSFDERAMARKVVNLQQSIGDASKVLSESLASRGIEFHVDCENAPDEILIQESRFHQMLVNLVKNSMEAIDELAEPARLADPHIRINCYLHEEYLVIDVVDNGIGVKKDQSHRIFSAGYTTKQEGSGLGLHSAANFIIASGGKIRVLSDGLGKGTTMRIMLRRSSIDPETRTVRPSTDSGGGGDD